MQKGSFSPMSPAIGAVVLFVLGLMCSPANALAPLGGEPSNGGLDAAYAAGVTDGDSQTVTSEVLPDGKIIVGGTFQLVNGEAKSFFVRVNADGTPDTTFNPGGSGPNGTVYEIIRLSDGKLLIGGVFSTYNGTSKSGLARLNSDGTLDTTFNTAGTGTTGAVQGMTLQPDGKILISSNFTAYNGTARFSVARINADGTLDTTFTSPFTSAQFVEEVDVLSDGRILIGGVFTLNGKRDVMRLNANGTVDTTFNAGGVGTDGFGVFAMAVQPDGKILIGGPMNTYNGVLKPRGARLNADGTLDNTFTHHVFDKEEGNGPEWIHVLSDGKILLAGGYFDGFSAYSMIRLNSNGSLDTSFTGVGTDHTGYHIAVQPDGKIMLTGFFNKINGQTRRNIVRVEPNGAVDPTFNLALTTYAQVFDIAQQSDGKTVVAGNFRQANGTPRLRLARFNTDGSLDPTFDPGESTFPDPVSAQNIINTIAIQSDGRMFIGGGFGMYNGTVRRGIARLNTNGSIDTSFNAELDDTEIFQNVMVQHLLVQPDGKLMVGGNLTLTTGTVQLIGRFHSNGLLDTTFTNGTSTNTGGTVLRIIRQIDGKYIVVGNYTNLAGLNRSRITRLNTDSSHDAAFNPGTGLNGSVTNAALQPDGKIVIGGAFTTYNGTTINRIARVNANGILDSTFSVGTGANSTVQTIGLQPDGKVVIGGNFSTYNGQNSPRLARLNANGTQDTSFFSGFANDATATVVRRLLVQADGKLLVSGTFRSYSGTARNSLARLGTAVPSSPALFDYDGDGKTDFSVFRPSSGAWYLQRSTAGFQGLQFGAAGDKLSPADYDGDGKTDISIYRPSTGIWYILNSATNTVTYPVFGVAEDLPAPGDYDGDGKADLNVFRPSQGTWYRQNSSNGSFFGFQFGANGDVPTVGDFDGDGRHDLGIWRPSNGDWYNIRSSNGSVFGERFGQAGDKIAPADYDGDGKTDIAIFRPATGLWVVRNSATATYSYSVFGAPADIPISGDYDGDGKADIGVWRPADGTWYIKRSDNGQFIVFPWGQNGDIPTPAAYGN